MVEASVQHMMLRKEALDTEWNGEKGRIPARDDVDPSDPQNYITWARKRQTVIQWRLYMLGEILPEVRKEVDRSIQLENQIDELYRQRIGLSGENTAAYGVSQQDIEAEHKRIEESYSGENKKPFEIIFCTAMILARDLQGSVVES